MGKEKKIQVENSFFDVLFFLMSFVVSFFRSVKLFFTFGSPPYQKNYFFDFLDFTFRIWARYFWKNPTLYKMFSFIGDALNFLFKKK